MNARRRWYKGAAGSATLACLLFGGPPARGDTGASAVEQTGKDLTEMSLEQLMNIRVTSVSKREESLFEAPAAVYVLTAEDLRRSGARSIPEALRLVPGLQVAQSDANKWDISARGFAQHFANKMLVLINGRSVYSPLFQGVFWEVQDLPMQDIERIEVIRGPGATLWGSNAVNGVINIITKRAADTQGTYLKLGAGDEERGFVDARYGGRLGSKVFYRMFGKAFLRDSFVDQKGMDAGDSWHSLRGGLRLDWDVSERDQFGFSAMLYKNQADQTLRLPSLTPPFTMIQEGTVDAEGRTVIGHWTRRWAEESKTSLQIDFDGLEHKEGLGRLSEHTFEFDFQHQWKPHPRHELVWGLGYRRTRAQARPGDLVSFERTEQWLALFNLFVQDRIALGSDRVSLTVGSKLERNDFTGFEIQPSVRLLWTPHEHHALWAAVSRAVRLPSWSEEVTHSWASTGPGPNGLPLLVTVNANRALRSEQLLAWEAGYRTQPQENLCIDLAAFYNLYDRLRTLEPGQPNVVEDPLPLHIEQPLIFDNKMTGHAYGVELAAEWKPLRRWTLHGAYSFLHIGTELDPTSHDARMDDPADRYPPHQVQLRSELDLPHGLQFDTMAYFVDRLSGGGVPAYLRLDLRLGWDVRKDLTLGVTLQNLLQERHSEFLSSGIGDQLSKIERSGYFSLTWRTS
jgi:iron complex outermembrane recepter protein